ARGRVDVMIGLSYYSYLPFLKAGLPVKSLPKLKEGNYGTGGSGNVAIIKGPAHPNSTRVFVNWVLGREGQEVTSRTLGQATRRLDVDTRFLKESGTIAAKDVMSVNDFVKIVNQYPHVPYENRKVKVTGSDNFVPVAVIKIERMAK